jgi:hypothetical protein
MPTINQLSPLTQVSGGDQLPIYVPNNGDARRVSISQLLTYFQTTFASPTLAVNLFVPGSGFNITVPTPVSEQQWMLLQPAGTLATGTITLPLNTGVPDGTTVLITTTQEITSLTIALNGASAIYGGVSSLPAGSAIAIRFYQPTNSWYQISAGAVYAASVQAFLATPSSANLRAAMTDETGTGVLVFNTSPTLTTPTITNPTVSTGTFTSPALVTPALGTVASGNISACTSTSMALVTPLLGTPTSGVLTSCTGLPLTTGVTGALPVANGGTGASATVQALSGPGAVDITSLATAFTSTAAGNALTLADGAQGQLKTVIYVAEAAGGDTGVLTPTNLGSATTITFNAVGDSVTLQFAGADWWVVGFRGAVVA